MYSPVIELRQYGLQRGKRDAFVAMFEPLIEAVEAAGADVVGPFLDLDDPDRFVWLRGYADMNARLAMLTAFFDGPVWRANREAMSALMRDTSNVLLLRPAHQQSGFLLDPAQRPALHSRVQPAGVVIATLYYFDQAVPDAFLDFFAAQLAPALAQIGVVVRASFVTLERPNNFPRHPIREHEHVFVWFAVLENEASYERAAAFMRASLHWRRELTPELGRLTNGRQEILRLKPTARSLPML